MEWYVVTKTINGRKYLYWQKTYRQGGTVKTLNKYIGPGANSLRAKSLQAAIVQLPKAHQDLRSRYDAGELTKVEYLEAITVKADVDAEASATIANKNAFTPVVLDAAERADDEHVRYGSLKKRMTRHRSKVRAAKANTKGIKKLNPFVAQVLVKK